MADLKKGEGCHGQSRDRNYRNCRYRHCSNSAAGVVVVASAEVAA
jgi:hypothetical protein